MLLAQAGELYRQCPPEARQTLNQALFDGLYVNVGDDGEVTVASVQLKPEFEALIRFTELVGITEDSPDSITEIPHP